MKAENITAPKHLTRTAPKVSQSEKAAKNPKPLVLDPKKLAKAKADATRLRELTGD